MKSRTLRWASLVLPVVVCLPIKAGEPSRTIPAGINDAFRDPDIAHFIGRYEREGREVYDKRERVVRECRVTPRMTVADVGAGTGLFTRMFSKQVGPEGIVYAVDISKGFVDHIEKTSRADRLYNVQGVVCRPDSVGLPPASTDLAFICSTYHHFEFPDETVRSIHRALRPDGHLILIDMVRKPGISSKWVLNHVRAGQETFSDEIVACGFRQVEEMHFMKDYYFVRFQKSSTSDEGRSRLSTDN